ncbi:MAG TPA: ComF family protein [Candidatus Acidoferrales bacterium]|nr:ComF family protein [Candidatus Acidoferrales bacterium]
MGILSRQRYERWLTTALDAVTSVVFPGPCRLCEELLTRASALPLCDRCLASFQPLPGRICAVCGQPLDARAAPEGEALKCRFCSAGGYGFDSARSYAVYEGALVRAIVTLKFEEITPLGSWFARRLAEVVQRGGETLAADVVVPVPLHGDRLRERGYNQAELIARPLARRLRLPYRPVLLVRTRPRPDKLHLTLEERWESVRGAFATRPGSKVDNLRVLLVDDVMTTGATLDACARALREAGAKSVTGLTVARALQNPLPEQ